MAKIILSGQNIDIYDGDGQDLYARTGATSLEMLAIAGAEGVIFGHSEVGDSAEVIRKKFQTLINRRQTFGSDFLPKSTILVGETWEEFVGHSTEQVAEIVGEQFLTIVKDIQVDFFKNLVLGYEPRWGSRGSGHDDEPPPTPELISACAKAMKQKLEEVFGESGELIPIIYGGRSTPERIEQILADTNVDGLILGSACNTVQKTLDIANAMIKPMGNKTKILHANFKAYNLRNSYEKYVKELQKLDDSFIIYLSPSHTDLRAVKSVL